ncbi:hypothetical protein [Haloquadratum walsbyi]|jgi:hypothetical protein|uniref:Uncharacterized protein n=1 Tax=Haloquadratum walsbyi J07HQW2 TaxID=1238425 RepID=U1PPC7_9EURY|nr:hypothetical protein [Haloquadratum walsbyi]ERG94151.1 MAG: hypothetical protein J07HQW2_00585 [Haloquadratum walsbyi J07HQW2]
MQVSFLLGESIVALLADKLDKAGHDVERVVDMDELGEGSATPRFACAPCKRVVSSSLATTRPYLDVS